MHHIGLARVRVRVRVRVRLSTLFMTVEVRTIFRGNKANFFIPSSVRYFNPIDGVPW